MKMDKSDGGFQDEGTGAKEPQEGDGRIEVQRCADTAADARVEILIYLLGNILLT